MKNISSLLFCVLLLSCNQENSNNQKETTSTEQKDTTETIISTPAENFQAINFDDLNKKLAPLTENLSPQNIMKMYYPYVVESSEGNETITMSETTLDNGNIEVKLIHYNLLDDSVKGEKYIMELKKQKDRWIVVALKKNWQCREGRGHKEWGIKPCS